MIAAPPLPGPEDKAATTLQDRAASAFIARSADFEETIARALASEGADGLEAIHQIYLTLVERAGKAEAVRFVLTVQPRLADGLSALLTLANRIAAGGDLDGAAPIWKAYVDGGGDDLFAYGSCVQYYVTLESAPEEAYALIKKRDLITVENASFEFLLKMIDVFIKMDDLERGFALCASMLEKDPSFTPGLRRMKEMAARQTLRAPARYLKNVHEILAFTGAAEAVRRIDGYLAQNEPESARFFAELCGDAGISFDDQVWLRWIFGPEAVLEGPAAADDRRGGRAPHHALSVNTGDQLLVWPTAWRRALDASRRPSPLALCLRATLAAATEESLLPDALTAEAAACAQTPLEHFLAGTALRLNRRWREAERHLQQARAAGVACVSLFHELTHCLIHGGQFDALERLFETIRRIDPEWVGYLCDNIASQLWNASDIEALYRFVSRPERAGSLDFSLDDPPLPFRHNAAHYVREVSMASLKAENEHFLQGLATARPPISQPWAPGWGPRLGPARIGYFFGMGNSFFQFPVLKHVDRSRFTTFFYYHNVRPEDAIDPVELECCDVFRALGGLSDERIVDIIREDQIDLLIVLDCLALKARDWVLLSPVARRLAYYGNVFAPTGNPQVDAILLPRSMADCFDGVEHHERLIALPDWFTLVSTQLGRFMDPVPDRASDQLVIGSAANTRKLTSDWFALVARIMARIPNSHLRIDAPILHKSELIKLRADARAAGIDPARFALAQCRYNQDFRERLAQIDLALDSFPAGCYFSAIQALSAGVPLLTLPGATPQGRGAMAVLNGAEIQGLLCAGLSEMEARAVALLEDPEALLALRRSLPAAMRASKFNDLEESARAWETALEAALEIRR